MRKKTLQTIVAVICGVVMAMTTAVSLRYASVLDSQLQTLYRDAKMLENENDALKSENEELRSNAEDYSDQIRMLNLSLQQCITKLHKAELDGETQRADVLKQELNGLRRKAQDYWNEQHNVGGIRAINADGELKLYLDTLNEKYGSP